MRPLRLDLAGFGTFRESVTIDFEDVDLVAIVGDTGAGKSTIIDAMVFALYGSVARYEDQRLVAPIINQLSTQALVSLVFEVGDQRYTATRVTKRTKTGASTSEARLESGSEVLAGTASEITEYVTTLLGLDFDRFTRTVVLPQGKFAAFLNDKGKDRQELLRHLLDLGVYTRIGTQARDRAKQLGFKRESLEKQLQEENAPTTANLDQIRQVKASLDDLGSASELASEGLEHLAVEIREASEKQQRVEESLRILLSVGLPAEVVEADNELAASLQQVADTNDALVAAQQKLANLDSELQALPSLEITQRSLEEWRRIEVLKDRIAAAKSDLLEARESAKAALNAERDANDEIEVVATRLADLRSKHTALLDKFKAMPALPVVESQIVQRQKLVSTRSRLEELTEALSERSMRQHQLVESVKEAASEVDRLSEELEHHRVLAGVGSYRDHLVEGEPCPLCEQNVAEVPTSTVDSTAEVKKIEGNLRKARGGQEAKSAQLAESQTAISKASGEIENLLEMVGELELSLVDAPTEEELIAVKTQVEAADSEIARSEDAMRNAASELEALENSGVAEKARRLRQEADERLLSLEASIKAQEASLEENLANLEGQPDAAQLTESISHISAVSTARDRQRTVLKDLENDAAEANRNLERAQNIQREHRTAFLKIRDSVAMIGTPPTATDRLVDDYDALESWCMTEARALENELVAIADIKNQASSKREETRNQLISQLDRFVGDHGDALTSVLEHSGSNEAQRGASAIRERLIELEPRSWSASIGETKGMLSQLHSTLSKQIELRSTLSAEVKVLKSDEEVSAELGRLLKTNGFERWLMGEIVEDLADRATGRLFDLSGGRYSLVADDADFLVVDHSNADERRDTRTLSGGETFLASLALALGLADSIAELAPAGVPTLGSLFLDEGFGTLDSATLDTVAAAIEELGATGRMVGIITHIRELADRMPIRFEVTKQQDGSKVSRVET